jgi:hypothetical protein
MENMRKFGDIEVGIDWIQGIVCFSSTQDFFNFCNFLLPINENFKWCDNPTRMGRLFNKSGISLSGVRIGYNENKNLIDAFFVIPGSRLKLVDLNSQIKVLKFLLSIETCKITRLDIAFNDFSKLLTPQILDCWSHSGYLRRFRIHSSIVENFIISHGKTTSLGATKTFGRRSSQKYLRIYEALPIHGIDAIRWELEVKDSKAMFIAMFLCSTSDLEQEICGHILGSIDFVCGQSTRTDRNFRLQEWENFLDYCGGAIKFSVSKTPVDFEKKLNWLFRQCSKNLAIANKILGKSIIYHLLDYGESKFTVLDDNLISSISRK